MGKQLLEFVSVGLGKLELRLGYGLSTHTQNGNFSRGSSTQTPRGRATSQERTISSSHTKT